MAYIERRKLSDGSTKYRVRIRIDGAKEASETFSSFSRAKAWGQKMETEIREGRFFPKDMGKERTFRHAVQSYIEKELPKNPKSQQKQAQLLLFWEKYFGKYFLCHITAPMIAEIRDDKLLKEITYRHTLRSPSTANRYLAALSRFFSTVIKEWGWLKENPVSHVKRPKEGKGRVRFLEEDEIMRLLEESRKVKSQHLFPIVLFGVTTGARQGEILGLRWSDVDLVRGVATFRDTKNGENRSVELDPRLLNILKEEKEKRIIPSPYVFPGRMGKPVVIRGSWDNMIKSLGWKDVVFHTLRHTVASHMAMNGESPLIIAEVLGHKDLKMTKRYSHLSLAASSQALGRMNKRILGGMPHG